MSDIVTTRIFTDGEKGITAGKMNDIIGGASVQTDFVATKPATSTVDPADQLLVLKSSGQYARAPFQTIVDSVNTQLPSNDSEIWSVRLRSFNSVGNCTFECDQRNAGATQTNPTSGAFGVDRWQHGKLGTMAVNIGQQAAALPDICVPSTSFRISRSFYRVTLTTAQASLGTTDNVRLQQFVEGPQWRELSNDVHSLQVLVRSSVANLKFVIGLLDPATTTKSLVKLATIPTANVWTLLTFPNLPIWPSGNFSASPGVQGYSLLITLAAGANLIAPAADTWQNGSFFGAPGMSNFAASAVNSTFDIAFVQHEPGPVCSTLMDKPFTQNLDECLRYYTKSYDYATAIATATGVGQRQFVAPASATNSFGPLSFPKPMAIIPTVTLYNSSNGGANSVRDGAASDHAGASAGSVGTCGFAIVAFSTAVSAVTQQITFHYKADTGW